ncbi:enhancer of yellow 2 transcription factor [Umbelopsis sp. PMI_123]|nr:enhancer of yellow 2 transcription factor [Umbelopsis sp. PMI_123]
MSVSNADLKAAIDRRFVLSGERSRLLDFVKQRLAETGWNDALYAHCSDSFKARGIENVSMDNLLAEFSDHARASVHENIKKELLVQIKQFLDANLD